MHITGQRDKNDHAYNKWCWRADNKKGKNDYHRIFKKDIKNTAANFLQTFSPLRTDNTVWRTIYNVSIRAMRPRGANTDNSARTASSAGGGMAVHIPACANIAVGHGYARHNMRRIYKTRNWTAGDAYSNARCTV